MTTASTADKDYDYTFADLQFDVDLSSHFVGRRVGDRRAIPSSEHTRDVPHRWWVDEQFPTCGSLNLDETAILFSYVRQRFARMGAQILEIGAHTGWATVHLAVAAPEATVHAVEPQLTHDPRVLLSLIGAVRSVGVRNVELHAAFSPDIVAALAAQRSLQWDLCVIDGNHNAPGPLLDAQVCAATCAETAAIFFHDVIYPAVADAVDYLRQNGWHVRVYQTQQVCAVCWRGDVEPPHHEPDPHIDWPPLPPHVQRLVG